MQSLHRVEKSPSSDGTGGITAGDLSAQSIMGAFSICLIPTCISARDDDVGERPSRHFDGRSGVEKSPFSDGTGSITREISRLRVSWERFPSAPYRHASPLEMTMLADPLSSFRPKRSGVEKSPSSDGPGSITAGDLSAQSIMGAFSICPIPTCISARDDDVGEPPLVISTEAKRSGEISLLNGT